MILFLLKNILCALLDYTYTPLIANHLAKFHTPYQTYRLIKFKMSQDNSSGRINGNHLFLLDLDEQQYEFSNLSDDAQNSEFDEEGYEAPLAEEESLNTQGYELESRLAQVNRGRRNLTRHEQLTLININHSNLQTTIESLERELFDFEEIEDDEDERYRQFEEYEPWSFDGTFLDLRDFDEGSNVTLPPNNVDHLLQTSSCLEINKLALNDLNCSICHLEYGKDNTEPALEPNQQLPGQESAEYPIKLPCGHVFGDWCIRRWLRDAHPASCPLCRGELHVADLIQ